MSDPIKNLLQPISLWMFDFDKRMIESISNFYLVAIVSGLLGITAFFYKYYCQKIIYLFHGLSKYLVFYLVAVVVITDMEEVVVAEMEEEVVVENDNLL